MRKRDQLNWYYNLTYYFNNFFMFTLSSAAGPSTSDDTLPKETDSPKCFKEKRRRPRSELTNFERGVRKTGSEIQVVHGSN